MNEIDVVLLMVLCFQFVKENRTMLLIHVLNRVERPSIVLLRLIRKSSK